MDAAADAARSGNVGYFEVLPAEELTRLLAGQDSDGRPLLHSAAASGSLPLTQFIANHGGAKRIDDPDDEVCMPAYAPY